MSGRPNHLLLTAAILFASGTTSACRVGGKFKRDFAAGSGEKPEVNFKSSNQSLSESSAGASMALTLSKPYSETVSVPFSLSGSATEDDHDLLKGSTSIAPGQTSGAITMTMKEDDTEESPENLIVTLGEPVNAVLGSKVTHTMSIMDDDGTAQIGEAAGDAFGSILASAGDTDGDSFEDYLVSAYSFDLNDITDIGKVYLYSGKSGKIIRGFVGEKGFDQFGRSAANAGLIDVDDKSDTIIGAPHFDGTLTDAGKIYVYSGEGGDEISHSQGIHNGENLGFSVAGACDYTGDAKDDYGAGAPLFAEDGVAKGRVYLYSGSDHSLHADFKGENAGDQFGYKVTFGCDFNGDKYGDIVISAPFYDGIAGEDTGKVYVYSGVDGSELWSQEGESALDEFGASITATKDLSGDAVPDLLVGAPKFDDTTKVDAGKVYVYSGSDFSEIRTKTGENAGDYFGSDLTITDDLSADSQGDYAVGAPFYDGVAGVDSGKVYVYSGSDGSKLSSQEGETPGENYGTAITAAGDQNQDSQDDVFVSSPNYSTATAQSVGQTAMLSAITTTIKQVREIFSIDGIAASEALGISLDLIGDIDGDGKDDLIVGSSGSNSSTGRIQILSGAGGDAGLLSQNAGQNAGDEYGYEVAGIGDFNNDGTNDYAVTAKQYSGGLSNSGKVYVYSGKDHTSLFTTEGHQAFGSFGERMIGIGDSDGDGFDDFVISEKNYSGLAGTSSGKVFFYAGGSGNSLFTRLGEAANNYFGSSLGIADINGDGKSDVLIGATDFVNTNGDKVGKIYGTSGSDYSEMFTIEGQDIDGSCGDSIAGLGDINGDQSEDFIVGCPYSLSKGPGKAFVYSGATSGVLFTFTGAHVGDLFGGSVAKGPDVDGDGSFDIIVGAPYGNSETVTRAGRVSVYSGANGTEIFTVYGTEQEAGFGYRVNSAGNFANPQSGGVGIVVSAPQADGDGGTDSGRIFGYAYQ
jgi:hypothetical protein